PPQILILIIKDASEPTRWKQLKNFGAEADARYIPLLKATGKFSEKQQQWTISAGIKTKNASDDKSKDFGEFEEKLNSSGNFAVYFPLDKCANTSCVF
ncbi:4832_t:CDS:2, partial [Entrophospora sp. SA101]